MNHIKSLQYEVHCVPPENAWDKWLITGKTQMIKMHSDIIIAWTGKMEAIADRYYSEFDGWGTIVDN